MSWIDVAIPGFGGLLATTCPRLFLKPTGDAAVDVDRSNKLRKAGMLLLGVAALYYFIKVAS